MMSQVQDSELSVLGTQLQELQALLERRLDEERQTRQQTLVGLERWISDRIAERDRTIVESARTQAAQAAAEVVNRAASSVPVAPAAPVASAEAVVLAGLSGDSNAVVSALVDEVAGLRSKVTGLEAQLSFIAARQDEFTQLLTTVREWVVKLPAPEGASTRI